MNNRSEIYVDGNWISSSGSESIDVINPSTEEVIGSTPAGTKEDVDLAIKAAKEAFPEWAAMPLEERLSYIEGLAAKLGEKSAEIGELISQEVGMPGKMSMMIQAGLPASTTASVSGTARDFPFEENIGRSLVTREPVGVVGCITPWNYPLATPLIASVEALLAGNNVILKPSEHTPLTSLLLKEIWDKYIGYKNAFQIVIGDGNVGEKLVKDSNTDIVCFTGSTSVGKVIARQCAETLKPYILELGGKDPMIILKDANINASDVNYINAHGTGTILNDKIECEAINKVFGTNSKSLKVSSTKAMHGHLIGATAAIELLACTLAISEKVIPPTINYLGPDPNCDLDVVPNYCQEVKNVDVVLNNSFAFGGMNAVLALKKYND